MWNKYQNLNNKLNIPLLFFYNICCIQFNHILPFMEFKREVNGGFIWARFILSWALLSSGIRALAVNIES